MTLITRLRRHAMVVSSVVAAATVAVGLSATPAGANPPINDLHQHVDVTSHTSAGQRRDPLVYGFWAHDRKALPTVNVHGSNSMATTTVFHSDSPVPGLTSSGGRGYCVIQTYRLSVMTPLGAGAVYRTTVQVRRHGKVVARHVSGGTFSGSTSAGGEGTGPRRVTRTEVRLPHFHFRPGDQVTWSYDGTLTNGVNKFDTTATIAPRCRG